MPAKADTPAVVPSRSISDWGLHFRSRWQAVLRRIKLSSHADPAVIYHYTDAAGLQGILESGQLRLCDVLTANDTSELSYGLRYGLRRIKEKLEVRIAGRVFGDVVQEQFKHAYRKADYFTSSFSRTLDDIGQWRGYADDGRGFVLKFDRAKFEDAFLSGAAFPAERGAFQVQYGTRKLRPVFSEILAEIDHTKLSPSERFDAAIELIEVCLNLALRFKHPAYRGEKEYRFIELAPAGKLVRKHFCRENGQRVEYRLFSWRRAAPGALRQIIIGPAAARDSEDYVRSISAPELTNGEVEIRRSLIPYRTRR